MTRRHKAAAGPCPTGPGHPASHTVGDAAAIEARLAQLSDLPTRNLRIEWQRLYSAEPPPRLSRDLLVRGVAWKIQERAFGGLGVAVRRRLRLLTRQLASGADLSGADRATLKPGARLVREWRGQVHSVTVLEDAFEYDGRRFRSLSQIAKTITGVHWSGPRFFGLAKGNVTAARSLPADDGEDP